MVDGTFDVCDRCGGEVNIKDHLHAAHLSQEDDGFAHLVWSHVQCGKLKETVITLQDYKSALSILQRNTGKEVPFVESEGDSLIGRFRMVLSVTRTIEDIRSWV